MEMTQARLEPLTSKKKLMKLTIGQQGLWTSATSAGVLGISKQ
jgi:hypothetical protein